MAALTMAAGLATRALTLRPSRYQAVLELIVGAIEEQIRSTMRVAPKPYMPLIGMLFLFILTANWSSLVPGVEPPTAHIETDAALAPETAELLLGVCVKRSFDRASVDGQLSTNDTAILMCSGSSGVSIAPESEDELRFGEALDALLRQLAIMMVADGEGAERIARVLVRGGHLQSAESAARAVANSPLVKAALNGGDPNWGRIVQAVGAARHGVLLPYLRAGHTAIGSINSPMQCMMKEVCAQCLQPQIDPITGARSVVFSCFNQDQALDRVDFPALHERLMQNGAQEKLTAQWVARVLRRLAAEGAFEPLA